MKEDFKPHVIYGNAVATGNAHNLRFAHADFAKRLVEDKTIKSKLPGKSRLGYIILHENVAKEKMLQSVTSRIDSQQRKSSASFKNNKRSFVDNSRQRYSKWKNEREKFMNSVNNHVTTEHKRGSEKTKRRQIKQKMKSERKASKKRTFLPDIKDISEPVEDTYNPLVRNKRKKDKFTNQVVDGQKLRFPKIGQSNGSIFSVGQGNRKNSLVDQTRKKDDWKHASASTVKTSVTLPYRQHGSPKV